MAQKGKIDWLRLEQTIREALRKYAPYDNDSQDPASIALHEISDALGDETGRGYVL